MSEPLRRAAPVPERIKASVYADSASGYVFDWSFHVACNYRCAYCYFEGHWEELKALNLVPPLETVLAAWKTVYERLGECTVLLNGGEPTVYPRFTELMSGLSRWHRWNFNTNLSWPFERWRAFARAVAPAKGGVQASFHPTEVDDHEDFVEKARAVRALGFAHFTVCIVAYPTFLDRFARYYERFKAAGLTVRCQPFVGTLDGKRYPAAYSAAERAMLVGLNEEMRSALAPDMEHAIGDASPEGKPCRTGQYYCHVNQLGEIYRCTQVRQRPGGSEHLGNLFTGFELRDAPTPCPLGFCRCGESRYLVERCG